MTDFDRAIDAVKELMDAHFNAIRVELHALRQRIDDAAPLRDDVEDLRTRVTALEAMDRSREQRLREARAYRRVHVPTFLIAGTGTGVALAAFLIAVF